MVRIATNYVITDTLATKCCIVTLQCSSYVHMHNMIYSEQGLGSSHNKTYNVYYVLRVLYPLGLWYWFQGLTQHSALPCAVSATPCEHKSFLAQIICYLISV